MLGDASRHGTSAQGLGQQVVGEIIERRKVREEEQVGKGEGWRYGSRKRSQDCVRTPTWGARWTEEEVVTGEYKREGRTMERNFCRCVFPFFRFDHRTLS